MSILRAFLQGIGSILDLSPTPPKLPETGISDDWRAVGGDIRHAMPRGKTRVEMEAEYQRISSQADQDLKDLNSGR